mgnify:CR=1 FL=1
MKLHHIGIVVCSIHEYEKNMIFQSKLKEIYDPIQRAKLALYSNFGDSYIELIEPTDKNSFTYNYLKKNNSNYHHICYEIKNENEIEELVSKLKLLKFKGPLPALLFNNKKVSFFFSKNKQIIEFISNKKQ